MADEDEDAYMARQSRAQMDALYDEYLAARGGVPSVQAAPQRAGILDVGGIGQRLGLLNQIFNPVEAIGQSMNAGGRMMSPNMGVMDRLAALGDMASGIAGVVAPVAAASRAGTPAATALMEGLLGGSPTQQAAADMARGFVTDESGALRLYHGSPHDFDRFSMSKIGTGEGAQAYGQGLYFAENEGIARGYRDALTDPDAVPLQFDGRPVNTPWNEEIRDRWPDYFSGLSEDDADAMEELLGNLSQVNNMADIPNVLGGVSSRARTLYSRVVKPKLTKPDVGAGSMYEVEINANPEDFINYDAPLSAQSLNVQRQFGYVPRPTPQEEVAAYELAKRESPNDIGNHPAVQDIYSRESGANAAERNFQRQVTGGGIDEAARISLSEAGIPGVRYLDAGSRTEQILINGKPPKGKIDDLAAQYLQNWGNRLGRIEIELAADKSVPKAQREEVLSRAKQLLDEGAKITREPYGTRNYVVFDENLINIVRKYGIAGAAAMLGVSAFDVEQAMAQGQQQPKGLLSTGVQ